MPGKLAAMKVWVAQAQKTCVWDRTTTTGAIRLKWMSLATKKRLLMAATGRSTRLVD